MSEDETSAATAATIHELVRQAKTDERERIAKFIESRQYEADGEGRGSKELADLVRGLDDEC